MDKQGSEERDGLGSATLVDARPGHEAGKNTDDPDFSTARALLKHLGTWDGDDLEELREELRATRSKAEF